jgi:hypothetical protein
VENKLMPHLHFGVNDVPYSGQLASKQQRRLTRSQRGYSRNKTTGQVMNYLEAKYSLIEAFIEQEHELITSILEKAAVNALKNDAPMTVPASDLRKLESKFKDDIINQNFDGLPGVPVKAAIAGVSHKYMHPFAKRASRASFIDTDLFRRNFKVWYK